jgi:ATP-dependent DNA ligase
MTLPLPYDLPPMESRSVDEIPQGDQWAYEPKWDGFRCIAFREGNEIAMQSKSGQPLARYFPELVEALQAAKADKFILDGEIVVPTADGGLSFDALLQRVHPAESRIRRLSAETPAVYIVFDLLADQSGKDLSSAPLADRRAALEKFYAKYLGKIDRLRLSPSTVNFAVATKWYGAAGAATDGLMAKDLAASYASGKRDAMVKIKPMRTADCVVGGFRYASKQKVVGSLLLGLYDDAGLLHHIGFCSGLTARQRADLTPQPLVNGTQHPVGTPSAGDRGGSGMGSFYEWALSPRHAATAVAGRQISATMHDGAGGAARGRQFHAGKVIAHINILVAFVYRCLLHDAQIR